MSNEYIYIYNTFAVLLNACSGLSWSLDLVTCTCRKLEIVNWGFCPWTGASCEIFDSITRGVHYEQPSPFLVHRFYTYFF